MRILNLQIFFHKNFYLIEKQNKQIWRFGVWSDRYVFCEIARVKESKCYFGLRSEDKKKIVENLSRCEIKLL